MSAGTRPHPYWCVVLLLAGLAAWCACVLRVQSLEPFCGGNTVSLRYAEEGGITEESLSRAKSLIGEETAFPRVCLWRQLADETVSLPGGGQETKTRVLEGVGETGWLLPAPLAEGALLSEGDPAGCVVSRGLAVALWRQDRVTGCTLVYQGRRLVVRGVLEEDAPLLLAEGGTGEAGAAVAYPNVELALPEGDTDDAEAFLQKAGLPQPEVSLRFPLLRFFGVLLERLPGWICLLAAFLPLAVWLFSPDGALRRGTPLHFGAAFLPTAVMAAAVGWAGQFAQDVPGSLIPSRWSDFAFWGEKWEAFLAFTGKLFRLPLTERELFLLRMLAGGLFFCMLAALLLWRGQTLLRGLPSGWYFAMVLLAPAGVFWVLYRFQWQVVPFRAIWLAVPLCILCAALLRRFQKGLPGGEVEK